MRANLLLSGSLLQLLLFTTQVLAQDSSTTSAPAPASATTSLTPEMSASSVSSFFAALATATPQQGGDGPTAGDVGSAPSPGGDSVCYHLLFEACRLTTQGGRCIRN
jgi:hypothetical protein